MVLVSSVFILILNTATSVTVLCNSVYFSHVFSSEIFVYLSDNHFRTLFKVHFAVANAAVCMAAR